MKIRLILLKTNKKIKIMKDHLKIRLWKNFIKNKKSKDNKKCKN